MNNTTTIVSPQPFLSPTEIYSIEEAVIFFIVIGILACLINIGLLPPSMINTFHNFKNRDQRKRRREQATIIKNNNQEDIEVLTLNKSAEGTSTHI